MPQFTTWCKQQQFLCLLFFYNNYELTVWQIFVSKIFKLRLFPTNTPHLHTRLTEFLRTQLSTLLWILYGKINTLINVFEGVCSRLHLLESSLNVNIDVSLPLCVLFIYIYICSVSVHFCLLVYYFVFSCLSYITQCANL